MFIPKTLPKRVIATKVALLGESCTIKGLLSVRRGSPFHIIPRYPICRGYNNYRLSRLACRKRLSVGCHHMGSIVRHVTNRSKGLIEPILPTTRPFTCEGGVTIPTNLMGKGTTLNYCQRKDRSVVPISSYTVRGRRGGHLLRFTQQFVRGCKVSICSRGAQGKDLHRMLKHINSSKGVVIILIATSRALPRRRQ